MAKTFKAVCGTVFIRGDNWKPKLRTERGWKQYAKREAGKMTKRDRFQWTGFSTRIEHREAFRISFGGQYEKY